MNLENFFKKHQVELYAALPFSECRLINPGLLERTIPNARWVLLYVIPYFTGMEPKSNLSLYAISKDYHLFLSSFNRELISFLKETYRDEQFCSFGDHSPIDEVDATLLSSLGIRGDNGLLITKKYGSYVFVGDVLTTADLSSYSAPLSTKEEGCLHCGACKKACPMVNGQCLSAITQQKKALSLSEEEQMLENNCIWGCDVCQTVCPLNLHIEKTKIPFFYEDRIPYLTSELLSSMSEEEFKKRAYAWRGRKVIERNLELFERKKKE